MLKRFSKTIACSSASYLFAEALERALPPLRYRRRAQYQRHFRPAGYDNPRSAVLAYVAINLWQNRKMTCYIHFRPDKSVGTFDGFWFQNAEAASSLDSNG